MITISWLSLIAAPVQAAGLAWHWTETPRLYHLHSQIAFPSPAWFAVSHQVEARITALSVEILARCTESGRSSRGDWLLDCVVDDAAVEAVAVPADSGTVSPIATQFAAHWQGTRIALVLDAHGLIKRMTPEFEPKGASAGKGSIHLAGLDALVGKGLFGCLERALLTEGEPAMGQTWSQKRNLLALPQRWTHEITEVEDGLLTIWTHPRKPSRILTYLGVYRFHTDGYLVDGSLMLERMITTEAPVPNPVYRERSTCALVPGDPPELGASGEVSRIELPRSL